MNSTHQGKIQMTGREIIELLEQSFAKSGELLQKLNAEMIR